MRPATFTIPNKITLIRVALIPAFVFFLVSKSFYSLYTAAFIFLMLSLSDFLDGYSARKRKQATDLGKLLDPIADKILIGSALVIFVGKGVPLWIAISIIAREFIITLLRIYVVLKGIVIEASLLGKLKTISQTIAVFLIMLKLPLAYITLVVATVLTMLSGINYILKIRKIAKN